MGRSRRTGASRPSGSSTASRPSSSSNKPTTTTAKPTAPTATKTTTPATTTPKPPATTSAQAPPATSGIGNFVANMAAATAGSVIGHTIAHSIFGGSSQPNNEQAPQQQPTGAVEEDSAEKNTNNPCFAEYQSYSKCIQSNQDTYKCQWAIDLLKECRIQSSHNGLRV